MVKRRYYRRVEGSAGLVEILGPFEYPQSQMRAFKQVRNFRECIANIGS
jgi:hypothetical protein